MQDNLATLLLLPILAISACTNHFETVVEIAASKQARTCDGRFTLKKLNDWAYRVDACEGPLYYRCSFARKSMEKQCCHLVEDESAATSIIGTQGRNPTCVAFVD